jgi:hypothetical protein
MKNLYQFNFLVTSEPEQFNRITKKDGIFGGETGKTNCRLKGVSDEILNLIKFKFIC